MHSSVLTQHRDPFQQQGAAASTKVVSNKKVVVLGCGFAGAAVAAQLDANFDVTVVSRHEEFVHYIGGLRAAVVPGFEKKVTIPLDNLLTRGTLLKGVEAVKVDESTRTVTLSNGNALEYDYLIVATGSLGPRTLGAALSTTTKAGILKHFQDMQAAIAGAQRILVVGGGPVGLELAGELAHYTKGKQITLVSSKGLMEDPNTPFGDKLKTTLAAKLKSMGVSVHLNAGRVDLPEPNNLGLVTGTQHYRWKGGEGDYDLAVLCTGTRQEPPLIAASGWQSKLDGLGSLKVDEHLQLIGSEGRVWALGDIAGTNETKLAYYSGEQVPVVAANVKAAAAGTGALKKYASHTKATAMIPLGPKNGAAEVMGNNLGAFLTKTLKGKSLMVPQMWATLKAGKVPQ